eukprot:UN07799
MFMLKILLHEMQNVLFVTLPLMTIMPTLFGTSICKTKSFGYALAVAFSSHAHYVCLIR